MSERTDTKRESDVILPRQITYHELDHDEQEFSALSPDYDESDIGKGLDLTISLFGYQLGSKEVAIIVRELSQHLYIDQINREQK